MFEKTMTTMIVFCLIGVNCFFVEADFIEIIDPIDDVIIISEDVFGGDTDEDIVLERTAEKPNIDITKLTYIREEDSTLVTLKLEVNSRGFIEDRNDFENVDPDDFIFTGSIVIYGISLETSENFYEIEYMAGNCTLNFREINATVLGNVLSVTFNLDGISETFVSLIGTTMQFDINSLTNITYYMDIAPDSALFIAKIVAPEKGFAGQQIEFLGEYEDIFGFSQGPYSYTWNFGDGTTSSQQNPTHTYQYPGSFSIELTIKDALGFEATDSKTIIIEYDRTPPEATIIAPTNALYILNNKIREYLFRNPLIFGNIDVIVAASDDESGIQSVEFYIGDTLVYIDTIEPFIFSWSNQETTWRQHHYTLRVTVRDHVGNEAYEEITVWKFLNKKSTFNWDIVVPDDYQTIQEAVNAANDGDSIFIRSNTYMENLFINKSIILKGENIWTTIIDGNHKDDVIFIDEGGYVNISGFTILNSGPNESPNYDSGIDIKSNDNIIIGNNICNNTIGIYSTNAQNNTFTQNIFDTNTRYGMYLTTSSDYVVTTDNTFINNDCGLRIKGSIHNNVQRNIFSKNDRGIYVCCGSRFNSIYHNTFINNRLWNAIDHVGNNSWDRGYPTGGNYWDDYIGVDLYGGADQNISGADGIGDVPYTKNGVVDNYPLGYFLNAPDFTLRDIDENTFTLSDFLGKVVIIDFMATWCQPCHLMEEELKEVYSYFNHEIVLISIGTDRYETVQNLIEFKNMHNASWYFALDTNEENVAHKYQISAIPTIAIVNIKGNISYRNVGLVDSEVLIKEVEKAQY